MTMPPEFQRFAEIFPADAVRHHFVGQDQARGVYAKELHIPAGFVLWAHHHAYDHLSILVSGKVGLTVDSAYSDLEGPCAITIRAGSEHRLFAYTDAVWFCIHPTDETEPDAVDAALIAEVS